MAKEKGENNRQGRRNWMQIQVQAWPLNVERNHRAAATITPEIIKRFESFVLFNQFDSFSNLFPPYLK